MQPVYSPCCCRVERRLEDSKTVAAFQFPGLPLDWCVLTYCFTARSAGQQHSLIVCRCIQPLAVTSACYAEHGAAACTGTAAAAAKGKIPGRVAHAVSGHCYREVRDAERRLRGALLLDGLQADDDYFLAR
jgi:hypothetical protein